MSTFAVQVSWDGAPVAGLVRMSPLRTTTEVVTFHEISTSSGMHVPGRQDVATVTLERDLGDDLAFHLWATGPGLRKEVGVLLTAADGGTTIAYRLHRCWVSEYAVAPDVATGVVLESLTLALDGWERVTPPVGLVAEGLAHARGVPVDRVSLAGLLTGRVEETERNLERVLATAEESGAVLLFDEADALFAHRSAVAEGNGRYASAEMSVLLDRLAAHRGQVVVTPPDEGSADEGPAGDHDSPP